MRVFVAAAVLFSLAACDETPTTPSRDELNGRWVVTSLQPRSSPPIAPPGGALAVEFMGDRVSVQTDCNTCSGSYSLTGGTLALSPLACTRRACPQGSLEGPFLDLLSTSESVSIVPGTTLIIEGRNGLIVSRR